MTISIKTQSMISLFYEKNKSMIQIYSPNDLKFDVSNNKGEFDKAREIRDIFYRSATTHNHILTLLANSNIKCNDIDMHLADLSSVSFKFVKFYNFTK